jgi:ferredoxin
MPCWQIFVATALSSIAVLSQFFFFFFFSLLFVLDVDIEGGEATDTSLIPILCLRTLSCTIRSVATGRFQAELLPMFSKGFQGPTKDAAIHASSASIHATAVSSSRAHRERRSENAPGQFWVDSTCIDCDTCRWMAPESYSYANGASAVTQQPETREQRLAALQALLSCPTFSIHADGLPNGELAAARDTFPLRIPGCTAVHLLGHHSENTYAAAPYLITRVEGNIMVVSEQWRAHFRRKTQGGVRFGC